MKPMTDATTDDQTGQVRIWDLPTRLFHWLLVGLIGLSWYSGANDMLDLHQWSGLTILTLVVFRLIWGVVGSTTARFSHFLKGPKAVRAYLREFFSNRRTPAPGHNPLGGWMVTALLIAVAAQGTMGLFTDDAVLFSGPLSHLVSEDTAYAITSVHEAFFNVILVLAGIHVAAILVYRLFKGEGLTWPMITGRKSLPAPIAAKAQKLSFKSPWLALAWLAVAAMLIWALITYI